MVLKLPLVLARVSGLLTHFEDHSPWYSLLTILTLLNNANFILPIGIFMVQNMGNLDNFTNAFGEFSAWSVAILKCWIFLSAKPTLERMLQNLRRIASDRSRSNFILSSEAERITESNTKKFLALVSGAVIANFCAPVLAMVAEYWRTGKVVDTRWDLPFNASYILFDVNKSPFFEIVYCLWAIGAPAIAICIASIDMIFMGLCLHTVALFKDLKENIRRVDRGPEQGEELTRNWSELIVYHNQILDLMKDIETVFSRIFFVQFNGAIFILCSKSYLAIMNLRTMQLMSYITFYLAGSAEFFSYAYFGDLLATESASVAEFVFGCRWYEKPPKLRLYYRMMMHRAQSSHGLSYLKWVFCSRRLYLTLILTSYNIFTVLRKVSDKRESL